MEGSPGEAAATSRRPLWLATAVAVAAVVVAVVAALSVPHWLSEQERVRSVVPRPPEPIHRLELPGTRTWQTVDCPPTSEETCAAPVLLDHAGVMFRRVESSQLDVVPDEDGQLLAMTVPGSPSDRWVLVGAERASADSRLTSRWAPRRPCPCRPAG